MSDFNLNALKTFNNIDLGNDNAIAKLNENSAIKSSGRFSVLKIFRFIRSSSTEANNNQVRTELLKSLGKAFGIEKGIGVGKNGEVTFSKEFMDKLEKLLGSDFKRSDFGIAENGGDVKSGKPLTQRRIKAIIRQAAIYETKAFSVQDYKNKLSIMMKELGVPNTLGLSRNEINKIIEPTDTLKIVISNMQKALDYLENKADTIIRESEDFVEQKNFIMNNEGKVQPDDERFEGITRFEMFNPKSGAYVPYHNNIMSGFNSILQDLLGGELIHLGRANFEPEKELDADKLKKYIKSTIEAFVKNGIDAYFESKVAGKVNEYKEYIIRHSGGCMENKGLEYFTFRNEKLHGEVNKALEAEFDNIVSLANSRSLKELIDGELQYQMSKNQNGEWEDYAPAIKKALVGRKTTIIEAVKGDRGKIEYKPLVEKGHQVYRAITDEDIDNLGKTIYSDIMGADNNDDANNENILEV